jgi:hypothetical protein
MTKFRKSVERLKAFCSLSDYFGDARFAALNQKNSTSLTLGTQTAFDFYPPQIFGGQARHFSRRLIPKILECRSQKPFKPCVEYCNLFAGHNTSSVMSQG